MKNRSLVLLSGEGTSIPTAEARALFLAYDPDSKFETSGRRLLIVDSSADPLKIGARIAFARRVGILLNDRSQAVPLLRGRRVRFRCFNLLQGRQEPDPEDYMRGIDATIDLRNPEYELTLVRADGDHLAVTAPLLMGQRWFARRPRGRPFFHPSAIFPKLSRALVNMSRCREGDTFLDPLAGTGSIPIEAALVGAEVVAMDQAERMVRGAFSNMNHFGQHWLGIIRADSTSPPLRKVDAAATDIPYGRASSTRGRTPSDILELLLPSLANIMKARSRLVLMHPQDVRVEEMPEFSVEEEHHLHVHKLLTRTITVLRRR